MISENTLWFWMWLIQATKAKSQEEVMILPEIWENLIIVNGANPYIAYEKAFAYGKTLEGDANGTLTLDGKPAESHFLGIKEMGVLHDGIGDMAEIIFRIRRSPFEVEKVEFQIRMIF